MNNNSHHKDQYYHEDSFSRKSYSIYSPPKLLNKFITTIPERTIETSLNQQTTPTPTPPMHESKRDNDNDNLASISIPPELTLDDLREKLKYEGIDDVGSSANRDLQPNNRDLMYSVSPNQMDFRSSSDISNTNRSYPIGSYRADIISTNNNQLNNNINDYKPREYTLLDSKIRKLNDHHLDSKYKSQLKPNLYNNENSMLHNSESTRIDSSYDMQSKMKLYSSIEKYNKYKNITPTKLYLEESTKSKYDNYASSFLRSTPFKNPIDKALEKEYISPEKQISEKLQLFDLKLAQVQEELVQSQVSISDPHRISLHTMPTISNNPDTDTINSHANKTPTVSIQEKEIKGNGNGGNDYGSNRKNMALSHDDYIKIAEFSNNKYPSQMNKIGSSWPRDLNDFMKEMKYKYLDTFLPENEKILKNPLKILKLRYDNKIEKNMKGCLEDFHALQKEIDYNLFNSRSKFQ